MFKISLLKSFFVFSSRKRIALAFFSSLLFFLLGCVLFVNLKNNPSSGDVQHEANKIAQRCSYLKYSEDCYAKSFRELTEKSPMDFAKTVLLALQDIDPKQSRGCHLIAHYISIAETKKAPHKWLELLRQQDSYSCSGGFIHGILEAHVASDPDFELNAAQFPLICNEFKGELTGELSCNHNLGHLLLVEKQNNIPQAVAECNLIEEKKQQYECLSGAFMERITRINLEDHGLAKRIPWNRENTAAMEKVCRQYSGIEAQACWKEMSYMYAAIHQADPVKVFEQCNKTPTEAAARECYIYGAGNFVTFTNFDQKNLTRVCSVYDPQNPLFNTCMQRIVSAMMRGSPKFIGSVIHLCKNAPAAYQERCFTNLGRSIKHNPLLSKQKEQLCAGVPINFKKQCLEV